MNRAKRSLVTPLRVARQEGARSLAHASREFAALARSTARVNERALQFTQGCWSTAPRLDGVT